MSLIRFLPHLFAPSLLFVAALVLAPSAHADWRAETGVFRIGVVAPASAPQSAERYEPFRAAVGEAIDMPTEIVVMRDAASLIDAHTSGRIEYAVLSSMGYAAARIMCQCLEPLAAPRTADGATGVRTVLIADRERVADMGALPGVGVVWGPKGSLTGDLIPHAGLRVDGGSLAGIELADAPTDTFGTARRAFLGGQIVALFAWDYADAEHSAYRSGLAARIGAEATMPVVTLWESPHVPFGPHTVRASVPQDIRAALTTMLLALDDEHPEAYDAISPALSGGFSPVEADDYGFAVEVARAVSEAR